MSEKKIVDDKIEESITSENKTKTFDNKYVTDKITETVVNKEVDVQLPPTTAIETKQMNIVQQNVLPLSSDFTKSIALTPNVLPTELRIGAAYEDALKLAAAQPNKLSTKMATFTTVVPHFYTIDNHMDVKPATYPTDSYVTFDGDKLVDYTCQAYSEDKRPKVGTIMIDFNDTEYGFTVDPKSKELFKPHKKYANIETNGISIPYQGTFKLTDASDTVIEVLDLLNYIIAGAIAGYGSGYLYSRKDRLEHTSDETFSNAPGMIGFSKLEGGGTLNQFFMPFERLDDGEFYVGRMSNVVTMNPIFSRMDGSIPRDDYVRYPLLLPLMSFKMSSEEIRVALRRAFPEPRVFGSLKTGIVTSRSMKLSERCALNADLVTYLLHKNFNTWMTSLRADQNLFIELLNSTFITRLMFRDQLREFQFTRASSIYLGAQLGRIDMSIFPHNQMFVRSFQVAERAPGFVTHTFSKVLNLIAKGLENFPFMSFEKSTTILTSATANMTYPGLGTALSASSLLINSTSPRVLALLATLNIMAPYTLFRACPVQYDTTKNPAVFALTLLGLVVKKYMFANIWMWNQVAWIADVHQFLMSYFPSDYSRTFNLHGYGSYLRVGGGIEVVSDIMGLDKLTCPITDYTINRPPIAIGLRNNQVLAQVMEVLSLQNWNGIPYILPPNRAGYRIRDRTIQVPGVLYGPTVAMAPRMLPIGLVLDGIINGPIMAYFESCKKDAMVKSSISAYGVLIKSFSRACESFAFYFHIIYNVVVTKAALIPDLFTDDVCVNPLEYNYVKCYYDSMRDIDPAFPYSTPQSGGLRILIVGINDELVGHNLTGQSVNVLLCAYNPMAASQGMNLVSVNNLNVHKTFAFLYESADSVYIISDFVDQLLVRQKYVECLQLVGELSINRLIVGQPALTQLIQETNGLLSGVTAAIWALLANIVNSDNQNINSFTALQQNIYGDNLEDPRNYRLTLAHLTPIDALGRTLPLPYIDPVRMHVRTNINLVVDRVLGTRYGLRKITQGVTYSMVPFRGSVTWTTRHTIPNNYVTIGLSQKQNRNVYENSYMYYTVVVSLQGGPDATIFVADPDELYKYVVDNDPSVVQPAYTVVLDNPATVTSVVTNFLVEAVNKCHCVIITQQATCIPTYNQCGSGEANESAAMSITELADAVTLGNLKIRKPNLVATVFETGSLVSQRIIRKMLAYNPSQPLLVYTNLHTTAVGAQFIQSDFYPIVVEDDDTAVPRAVRNGVVVNMIDYYPFSLTTVRNVNVAPTQSTLSAFTVPA